MPTGEHAFDKLCAELGIEHRLTKPRTPQTNGMVERFNGRISDVLQSHHFVSGEDLAQTLYRYVLLYNQQLPQSTLGSKTPLDAMQRWYTSHPHLFVKRPCNLAGGDRVCAQLVCFNFRFFFGGPGLGVGFCRENFRHSRMPSMPDLYAPAGRDFVDRCHSNPLCKFVCKFCAIGCVFWRFLAFFSGFVWGFEVVFTLYNKEF